MIERKFLIINKLGLHARAAAKFVTTASEYGSDIQVERNNRQVNGKSIMGVMMLAAAKDSEIIVRALGEDAEQALDAIGTLIHNYFGEGE